MAAEVEVEVEIGTCPRQGPREGGARRRRRRRRRRRASRVHRTGGLRRGVGTRTGTRTRTRTSGVVVGVVGTRLDRTPMPMLTLMLMRRSTARREMEVGVQLLGPGDSRRRLRRLVGLGK